jgi:hypothetical protein
MREENASLKNIVSGSLEVFGFGNREFYRGSFSGEDIIEPIDAS